MGAIGGAVFQSIKGFRNAPTVCQATRFFKEVGLLTNHFTPGFQKKDTWKYDCY